MARKVRLQIYESEGFKVILYYCVIFLTKPHSRSLKERFYEQFYDWRNMSNSMTGEILSIQ